MTSTSVVYRWLQRSSDISTDRLLCRPENRQACIHRGADRPDRSRGLGPPDRLRIVGFPFWKMVRRLVESWSRTAGGNLSPSEVKKMLSAASLALPRSARRLLRLLSRPLYDGDRLAPLTLPPRLLLRTFYNFVKKVYKFKNSAAEHPQLIKQRRYFMKHFKYSVSVMMVLALALVFIGFVPGGRAEGRAGRHGRLAVAAGADTSLI